MTLLNWIKVNIFGFAVPPYGTKKFGKHPKKTDRKNRTLQLSKYTTEMAPPPTAYNLLDDVSSRVKPNDVPTLFGMLGNDKYGNCVMVGGAHFLTLWNALIGILKTFTTCFVVKWYKKLTGGGDNGLNMLDVLKQWVNDEILGESIIAFAEIDPRDHVNVMRAISVFKGAYLGFNVQQDCMADFDAIPKIMWTPGILTNDGHCVDGVAYNSSKVTVLTWADKQDGSWDWWDECVDECYVIIPKEAEDPNFAPGFDLESLKTDLAFVQKQ
jgi:hypothetical protein